MAKRTVGSQIVPARPNELRRVLLDLTTDDISQLDAGLGVTLDRPLGRELLASRLPMSNTVYVCLFNLEPSAMIAMHRSPFAVRIRALATCPDQRRKGLARTLLMDAAERVREHGLEWMWMQVPSANDAGTRCALTCGFRRYRPQFLRRSIGRSLAIESRSIYLKMLSGLQASQSIMHWFSNELNEGDPWIEPLVSAELMPILLPTEGQTWACMNGERELGCAHLNANDDHQIITLWLDNTIWNSADEMACLRAVLSTLDELPPQIDLWLGSSEHLRASVARYKALDFKPVLSEQVIFARHLAGEAPA